MASTTAAPTTTAPTTTAPPRPIYIGDKVMYDDWYGAGVRGIVVDLLRDTDRNGVGEGVQASATTSDSGAYSFNADPGCYVVSFQVPSGQQVLAGDRVKPVCLGSGADNNYIDLVISRPSVKAPVSCEVQVGNNRSAGVEVGDPNRAYAPSYAFYDSSGKFLLSTSSLGPPDDVEQSPPSVEWTSDGYRFEESAVASVAAEDGKGNTSTRTTCRRFNV